MFEEKKYDDTICGELTFDCCKDCVHSNKVDGGCDMEERVFDKLLFIGNHVHCSMHSNGKKDCDSIIKAIKLVN